MIQYSSCEREIKSVLQYSVITSKLRSSIGDALTFPFQTDHLPAVNQRTTHLAKLITECISLETRRSSSMHFITRRVMNYSEYVKDKLQFSN